MKTLNLPENNYLNEVLLNLEKKNVSDIHLQSGGGIYYRLLGSVNKMESEKAPSDVDLVEYLKPILDGNISSKFKEDMLVDFAFGSSNHVRYRANLYRSSTGLSLALRRISNKVFGFDELGIPSIMEKISSLQKGLVIVSGSTGSGKSTTLTAIIDYINSNFKKHIITIEDPIEFVHKNKQSLINQREVGVSAKNFNYGVISALREDPDVILIGEIRDSMTIKECLRAAETGHLVFTTLHTQTAAKAVDRIVDSCDAGEKDLVRIMLSTSLQAVISQKLLKRKDNSSMVAAYEILLGTGAIRNLIRENKIGQIDSMIQTGSKYGMINMETSIKNLFEAGIIEKSEMDANLVNVNDVENDK
ncbi:MAG: PilT/PilU family type 4a pilus ATPase [Rickettsiales bacterium]|jgi:twitching motility protein PilT|nr:PilT/PilU family type 4a pilus ATPase [Rickettsiales bacterium]